MLVLENKPIDLFYSMLMNINVNNFKLNIFEYKLQLKIVMHINNFLTKKCLMHTQFNQKYLGIKSFKSRATKLIINLMIL